MKRKRHTPNQVIGKLREAERMLREGKSVPRGCQGSRDLREHVPPWRNQAAQAAQEGERSAEADRRGQELDIQGLKEIAKTSEPGPEAQGGRHADGPPRLLRASGVPARRQHRSTQREPGLRGDEEALRRRLREISEKHPRWGYRRAHAELLLEGSSANRTRVQRIWREEGLRVPARKRKRRRLGVSTATGPAWLIATHPNHVWALDFQHDATTDGREHNAKRRVVVVCVVAVRGRSS